jgi:hypothetical protein
MLAKMWEKLKSMHNLSNGFDISQNKAVNLTSQIGNSANIL